MKKYVKRGILLFVVFFMLFSFLACTGSSGKDKQQSISKDGGVKQLAKLQIPEVKMLTWTQTEVDNLREPLQMRCGGILKETMVPGGQVEQKMIAGITSGDSYDLVRMNTNHMPKYAIKGLLQPMEQYIDFSDPVFLPGRSIIEQFKYKGIHYTVPVNVGAQNPWYIIYNQTLFENNGIKTPKEYAKEKKWTWDTFREVAAQMTLKNNNIVDVWGFMGPQLFEAVMLSYDKDFVRISDDGLISHTMDAPEIMNAFQFYQDAVIKYKYSPDRGTVNKLKQVDQFVAGKVAMILGRTYMIIDTIKDNIKYEWDIAPLPVPDYTNQSTVYAQCGLFGIPEGAPNPEGAAAAIYVYWTDVRNIVDTTNREYLNPEQMELVEQLSECGKISLYSGIGKINNIINSNIIKDLDKGLPVSSSIEKYKPLIQQEIDAFMEDAK